MDISMTLCENDKAIINPLAERYGEISRLAVQQERMERYRRTNALECVRPVVLVNEVPWGGNSRRCTGLCVLA